MMDCDQQHDQEAPPKEKEAPNGGFYSIKPEDVLAELRKMHPGMHMITNKDGVLCITVKDFFMATCGMKESSAKSRVFDLRRSEPELYKKIISGVPPIGERFVFSVFVPR